MNPHAPGGTGRNVIGLLPGTERGPVEEYVVIGAHIDHLGWGGIASLARGERAIHNGADDNASGVAAMLAIAEKLAVGPRPRRPVVFMAFTGEEIGLLGSAHWVRNPTLPLEGAVAMINLDMVGRLEQNGLVVYGVGTAEPWREMVEAEVERMGIGRVSYVPDGYGASDQTSFYVRDIPVLHLFTNTHSDYHRPSDEWDRIDVAGLQTVAELVAALARDVGSRARMEVIPDVGRPAPRAAEAAAPGYGTYLGTIPDFSPVEHGVLLGGVREGSPAALAGLRTGDILVGLGGREVDDLYALTALLQSHQPGDRVVLEWVRDGERMRAETTLTARP
jgi:membrane-associated protease RseP (regulator of RpoE activity)